MESGAGGGVENTHGASIKGMVLLCSQLHEAVRGP